MILSRYVKMLFGTIFSFYFELVYSTCPFNPSAVKNHFPYLTRLDPFDSRNTAIYHASDSSQFNIQVNARNNVEVTLPPNKQLTINISRISGCIGMNTSTGFKYLTAEDTASKTCIVTNTFKQKNILLRIFVVADYNSFMDAFCTVTQVYRNKLDTSDNLVCVGNLPRNGRCKCGDYIGVISNEMNSNQGWFCGMFDRDFLKQKYEIGGQGGLICTWNVEIQPQFQLQIRFIEVNLEEGPHSFVKIEVLDITSSSLSTDDYKNIPGCEDVRSPRKCQSRSNKAIVRMHLNIGHKISDIFGFNATYQRKGFCLPGQHKCAYEDDCFTDPEKCNLWWDCPLNGSDELGCNNCAYNEYSCSANYKSCYKKNERCDGINNCHRPSFDDFHDEWNCSEALCNAKRGTWLCDNKECIHETERCNGHDACSDGSDERDCPFVLSRRVIVSFAIGVIACILLFCVVLSCARRLMATRKRIRQLQRLRRSVVLAEIFASRSRHNRRLIGFPEPPPCYHDAIEHSRPFEEVARERYLQAQAIAMLSGEEDLDEDNAALLIDDDNSINLRTNNNNDNNNDRHDVDGSCHIISTTVSLNDNDNNDSDYDERLSETNTSTSCLLFDNNINDDGDDCGNNLSNDNNNILNDANVVDDCGNGDLNHGFVCDDDSVVPGDEELIRTVIEQDNDDDDNIIISGEENDDEEHILAQLMLSATIGTEIHPSESPVSDDDSLLLTERTYDEPTSVVNTILVAKNDVIANKDNDHHDQTSSYSTITAEKSNKSGNQQKDDKSLLNENNKSDGNSYSKSSQSLLASSSSSRLIGDSNVIINSKQTSSTSSSDQLPTSHEKE